MEVNNEPSLTEPDMTLSLREMLDRLSKGQPVTLRKDGTYEDEDFTDYEGRDISEIEDLKAFADQEVKEKQTAFDELVAKKQAEALSKRKSKESPPEEREPEV